MNKFFEDTMTGLLEAITMEKGEKEVHMVLDIIERENINADIFEMLSKRVGV